MLQLLVIQSETEGFSVGACHSVWVGTASKALIKRSINSFPQSLPLREFGKELEKNRQHCSILTLSPFAAGGQTKARRLEMQIWPNCLLLKASTSLQMFWMVCNYKWKTISLKHQGQTFSKPGLPSPRSLSCQQQPYC